MVEVDEPHRLPPIVLFLVPDDLDDDLPDVLRPILLHLDEVQELDHLGSISPSHCYRADRAANLVWAVPDPIHRLDDWRNADLVRPNARLLSSLRPILVQLCRLDVANHRDPRTWDPLDPLVVVVAPERWDWRV